MSRSTREAVVLTEEAYQRLLHQVPSHLTENLDMEKESHQPESPIALPMSQPSASSASTEENLEQCPPETTIPEEHEDQSLHHVPSKYRTHAVTLFNRLKNLSGIDWDGSGDVYIGGQSQHFNINQLVKTACVPFTNASRVPVAIRNHFKEKGIKVRNHLFYSEPETPWHPYFAF